MNQFVEPSSLHLRLAITLTLIFLAIIASIFGYLRWRSAQLAMRLEEPLPPIWFPFVLALGMVAISLVGVALVLADR